MTYQEVYKKLKTPKAAITLNTELKNKQQNLLDILKASKKPFVIDEGFFKDTSGSSNPSFVIDKGFFKTPGNEKPTGIEYADKGFYKEHDSPTWGDMVKGWK